jgi:hypothetical protein
MDGPVRGRGSEQGWVSWGGEGAVSMDGPVVSDEGDEVAACGDRVNSPKSR